LEIVTDRDVLGDRNVGWGIKWRMLTGLFGAMYAPATCCCHGGDEMSSYWLLKELRLLAGILQKAVASFLGGSMTVLW
jgi:hypothetical protein